MSENNINDFIKREARKEEMEELISQLQNPQKVMTKPDMPIFQYLVEHLGEDGRLKQPFSLRLYAGGDEQLMVDGMYDGVNLRHAEKAPLSDEAVKIIDDALVHIGAGEFEEGEALLKKISHDAAGAVVLIPDFLNEADKSLNDETAPNLLHESMKLMLQSDDFDMIKLGILMSSFFVDAIEDVRKIVWMLGLSDEFTLYSLIALSNGEHAAEDMFALAQATHGWGRIHAVAMLEPYNKTVRDWLLQEGVHNRIMPQYSAFDVYAKINGDQIMREELTQEQFVSLGEVLLCMFDLGGPAEKIDELPDPAATVFQYLSLARNYEVDEDTLHFLKVVENFIQDDETSEGKFTEHAVKIFEEELARELLREARALQELAK